MGITGAGVTGHTEQRAETKDSQLCKKTPKFKVKKKIKPPHTLCIFSYIYFRLGVILKECFLLENKD